MRNYSLITLVLCSLSLVFNVAAIPMDSDAALLDIASNTVLNKDVIQHQRDSPETDTTRSPPVIAPPRAAGEWVMMQESGSHIKPLLVSLLMMGVVGFFLARKSASTK